MNRFFFLIVFLIGCGSSVVEEEHEWKRAYLHSTSGKQVTLNVTGLMSETKQPVTFYLVDEDDKYIIGSISVKSRNKENLTYKMDDILRNLKKPLSKNAFIKVEGTNQTEIRFDEMKVIFEK